MTAFSMYGALMFASKVLMQFLPNIHLLGMFIMVFTVVYRQKALIPIYLYVLLDGIFGGFSMWWLPYLYIWTVLWAVTMLLPKYMSKRTAMVVYPIVCAAHGFMFGTLYAPAQALMFGLNFHQTLAWIATGLPYDAIHGVANLMAGLLIAPLSTLLGRLNAGLEPRIVNGAKARSGRQNDEAASDRSGAE